MSSFPFLSDADHRALDGELYQLMLSLAQSPSLPYGTLASSAEEIINNMERKRLMRPGWKEDWRDSERVYGSWFGDLGNAVNKALHAAFTEMVRYVLSASNPYEQEEYGAQLITALRFYLAKRGYEVTRQPAEPPGNVAGLAPAPLTKAVHNSDFTMVNWFGTEYHFALGVQSSAVRALWEEWEGCGLGLHQETIRNMIDTERDTFRVDTAFRNHPAFETMIQRCGDGRYKLAPPKIQAASSAPNTRPTAKRAPKSRRKRS